LRKNSAVPLADAGFEVGSDIGAYHLAEGRFENLSAREVLAGKGLAVRTGRRMTILGAAGNTKNGGEKGSRRRKYNEYLVEG
jgi:hypothetical protein